MLCCLKRIFIVFELSEWVKERIFQRPRSTFSHCLPLERVLQSLRENMGERSELSSIPYLPPKNPLLQKKTEMMNVLRKVRCVWEVEIFELKFSPLLPFSTRGVISRENSNSSRWETQNRVTKNSANRHSFLWYFEVKNMTWDIVLLYLPITSTAIKCYNPIHSTKYSTGTLFVDETYLFWPVLADRRTCVRHPQEYLNVSLFLGVPSNSRGEALQAAILSRHNRGLGLKTESWEIENQ